MKSNPFDPLMEGSYPQPEVDLTGYVEKKPEVDLQSYQPDIPEPTIKPQEDTESVLDTSTFEVPEETKWFDDTWNVVKASAEVSAAGEFVSDKLYEIGLKDVSPEVAGLYTALGADPEDLLTNIDMDFRITDEMVQLAKQKGVTDEFLPVLDRSYNAENFVINVQKALDYQKAYQTIEAAPIGSQLVGGIVEGGLDPLSFASGGAAAGMNFVKKGVITGSEAALGAIASEFFKEERTGKEAEYGKAAVGAFVFGTSLSGLSDGISAAMGTRMKARQDSIDADVDDVSRIEIPDWVGLPESTKYVDHPDEVGAVITRNGDTISATNPANPKNLEAARKANKGVQFVNLQDINQTVLTSESDAVRALGADLFRSSTGMQGGGTGKTGMTADDIISMMEGRDNMFVNDFADAYRTAMKKQTNQDPEEYWRKIVTSIENGKTEGLNPEDLEVIKLWQAQMQAKNDAAINPAMFGRQEAPAVFSSSRDPQMYVPQVFDIGKTNMMKQRLGGWEGLHKALKDNWEQQFKIDHNGVKTRLREVFNRKYVKTSEETGVMNIDGEVTVMIPEGADIEKMFEDFVADYIEKKSYGIAKNGDFTHSSVIEDMNINDSLVGIQNNNFALERNFFDSSFITTAEGGMFSVNDLRLMDMGELASMYNRRINGDIAIHGATGKSTRDLKNAILAIDDKKAQKALKDWVKLATGRSRNDPQGAWDMLGRSLMDATYATKNAMMWHMQAAEGVGFVADRILKLVRGGIPAVKHMMNPEAKFSKSDIQDFRSAMFGKELNTRLSVNYKGVRDHLVDQGVNPMAAEGVAAVRTATAWAANKSPFTKMFNKTTETLVNMARDGVISDITDAAMLGKNKFTDEYLRNASITPEQFKGILKLIKSNTKVNSKGEYKADINKIIRDVRANDLWRLADYVANDQLFRTNKVSQNYTTAPNTLSMMALQFKSFMIKGINGKFLKMAYESGQGRAVDHMLNAVLASGAAAGIFAMQAHYKAVGMSESKRKAYLEQQLSAGNLTFQAINRSSVTGSPLGAVSMAGDLFTGNDIFSSGRTTVVAGGRPQYEPNASNAYRVQQEFMGRLGRQIPAVATGAGLYTSMKEGYEWLWADEGYDELSHGTALFKSLRQVMPNDPMMQALLNDLAENVGVLESMN